VQVLSEDGMVHNLSITRLVLKCHDKSIFLEIHWDYKAAIEFRTVGGHDEGF
jgi:hypothetical protein